LPTVFPEKISLTTLLSKTQIEIDADMISELLRSYLLVIPNEKRDFKMAIRVSRFADSIFNAMKSEGLEAEKYIDSKVSETIAQDTQPA